MSNGKRREFLKAKKKKLEKKNLLKGCRLKLRSCFHIMNDTDVGKQALWCVAVATILAAMMIFF